MAISFVMVLLASCGDDPVEIIPPSAGSTIDAEVGGDSQPNTVFIDFSGDVQTPVERTTWDFALYSQDQFVVTLNSSNGMLAYELDKTSLEEVTAEDTLGLGGILSLDAIFGALFAPVAPPWLAESIEWADNPNGDLDDTAIDELGDGDDGNVYIINRGTGPNETELGWVKARFTVENGEYVVETAEINSTSVSRTTVAKSADQEFIYLSIDNGIRTVEPGRNNWDIAFSTYIDILNFGANFPYGVRDWVLQNRNSETAEVIIEADEDLVERYEAFTLADVGGVDFNDEINAIGGNWRTVASPTPGSVTAVRSDRFYIIEDADGNYYKFVFTRMLSSSGERGFPQVSYELLQ
jgi:hypothetical protein